MNVSVERYQRCIELGLMVDWIVLLSYIREGKDLSSLGKNMKVQGTLNLLQAKGYLTQDYSLSEASAALLGEIEAIGEPQFLQTNQQVLDFDKWVSSLLISLKGKMKEMTGREQIKGFGGVYFIPSLPDLKARLVTYKKNYKGYFNPGKIEACLLQHIENCASGKSWAPSLKYFITKEGKGSELAAAIENWEEMEEAVEQVTNQRFV